MDEPFNSSDVEFSPVQSRYANAGSNSVVSMSEKLFEDRISSKRTLTCLVDARGAPATQYARSLWLNRLKNYIAMNKILIDSETGPNSVTMIRFIDTIVKHMRARETDVDPPSRNSFRSSILLLFRSLIFEYPKFHLTNHERARMDAVIDTLADEGKLSRGIARKHEWVGIYILEKMCRCWLQTALDEGCISWDITLHKTLEVVLQSAANSRAGEVALSQGYKEEYLKWGHLSMKLSQNGNTIDDIELSFLLKYEKNKKREKNDDRDIPLKTLRDPSLNVVCPVKLLLIQALRSGNISSIDNALNDASLRLDRTIQWLYPKRPVVPQLKKSSTFISWDLPARATQVNNTTKEMGYVAGVLADLVSHDLRRGAGRDNANLKPSSNLPIGVATREVAQLMGHSSTSFLKGTTDKYVGPIEQETYSARAEQMFISRKAPTLTSNKYKKRRIRSDELTTFCEENNLNPASSHARRNAGGAIHKQRKAEWIKSEKNSYIEAAPTPISRTSILSSEGSISTTSPAISTASLMQTTESSPIDPCLLALDGHDVEVDAAAVERLDLILQNNVRYPTEHEQAMALDMFVDNLEQSQKTGILILPGREFVEAFSRINIVRISYLQGHIKSVHELFAARCPMGNSRDYPELFTFKCSKCSEYSTQAKSNLVVHEVTCQGENSSKKKEKLFICDHPNCRRAFKTAKVCQEHIASDHSWEPVKCNIPGCTDDQIFANRSSLTRHLVARHRPISPPIRCSFPGCKSETLWGQVHNYRDHLRLRHKLVHAALQKPYLPEDTLRRKLSAMPSWQPVTCPIGGSPGCKTMWQKPESLTRHLRKGIHALSLPEASRITREIRKRKRGEPDHEGESPADGEHDQT